ncbi:MULTISPECIES: TetR/AcrR family transcriptional regulator [Cytobacillus]|uniref:TetR/AcrR family transcriptional regulator n=1 Tax=Cytobacillus stercorigallinarum TaxID=2762240 RepID=A0ABR8QN54_9BACI|nr:TetR/AcrR family transcriptional regulator [Cytobacillus stercorigallinarum]MBD7936954.1 TetR/AcrR family transcriptional regulator [Cytobacillus stercorigallinarum]
MGRDRKFSITELYEHTQVLLLEVGYEAFTFSLLAERLNVARGTIYKYFDNKDELITAFMIYEMNQFMKKLEQIEEKGDFEQQFAYLMEIIFERTEIQELINITMQVNATNEKAVANQTYFKDMRINMYTCLQNFIRLGKQEGKLNPSLPDTMILGFIFQSVAIPNHFQLPREKWIQSIIEMVSNGIRT